MIADILQRNFMLQQLQDNILPELKKAKPTDDRRAADELPQVSAEQMLEAAATLEKVLADEAGKHSLTKSVDDSKPADATQPNLEDISFFSSCPEMGLLQSLLQQRYEKHAAEVIIANPVGAAGRRGPSGESMVTGRSLAKGAADRRLFGAFQQTDARWVACKFAEALTWMRGPDPFPKDPAPAFSVAANARFVIVGDWGSGIERAKKVATLMRKSIAKAVTQQREVHAIHLGDVYYSGTEDECKENFLGTGLWPVQKGSSHVYSWALNANHDMFSGGRGYFRQILKDERFANQNQSNRFELVHPRWTILGLDTAYADHDLAGDQASWIKARLTDAHNQGRQGMLLSHHQLFSAYEGQGIKLYDKLRADVLSKGLVHTWLWGHEHRLCAYGPYLGVKNARCIGHGGVPVYQFHKEDDPAPADGPPLLWEFRESFRTTLNLEPWALFGYAVADFVGDEIHVSYIHENAPIDPVTGEPIPHKTEIISALV